MTRKRQPPSRPKAGAPTKPAAPAAPRHERPIDMTDLALLSVGEYTSPTSASMAARHKIDPAAYGARERAAATHAMDFGPGSNARDALSFVDATAWPGFPTLSLLAQLPEYRTMHETLADEAVRTWGKIVCTSEDEGASEKVKKLTQALERYKVRSLFRTAVIHDQAFGGAHIYPRMKQGASVLPADTALVLDPRFVARGSLDCFTAIEPYWITPNAYNSTDPTAPHFYKPESWYMLAKVVHATRVYTMISRPVADMLKAAYSFRGISMSQLAMPYVDNWLRTRQSVSDTVKQFSVTFLKCDMAQMLQPGGAYSLINRAQLFNLTRDNRNLAICDNATEDFAQLNTPLSGLDALQAQSQEQMSAVSHIPLVKLTGITPAGLNANSDGEIRVWYDYVAGYQSHNLSPLMLWVLQLIQLSEFGAIDPGLSWEWNPLYELTDLELADVREKNARTDSVYAELGVVSPEVIQERLTSDPLSGYASILTERDELDEVADIAEAMLQQALNPQPEPTPDGTDPNEPDPQAASAGGRQPGAGS